MLAELFPAPVKRFVGLPAIRLESAVFLGALRLGPAAIVDLEVLDAQPVELVHVAALRHAQRVVSLEQHLVDAGTVLYLVLPNGEPDLAAGLRFQHAVRTEHGFQQALDLLSLRAVSVFRGLGRHGQHGSREEGREVEDARVELGTVMLVVGGPEISRDRRDYVRAPIAQIAPVPHLVPPPAPIVLDYA